jgi:co-chaperonin GroES (HSP10)
VRVLRGRVVVRELKPSVGESIWTPAVDPRDQTTHTGKVLAVGPGAFSKGGVECPIDVKPGDVCQFHFEGTEKGRLAPWEDGKPALYLAQREIDGVWE